MPTLKGDTGCYSAGSVQGYDAGKLRKSGGHEHPSFEPKLINHSTAVREDSCMEL
jgi:hypothetical protein